MVGFGRNGLEGYRWKLPRIEREPGFFSYFADAPVKYEDMPTNAEQRALKRRDEWIERDLREVSKMFSKLAITEAETSSLLRAVEEDLALVHAAYYTDDECIARIADCITAKG